MAERPLVFECAGSQLLGILHETEGPAQQIGIVIVVGGPQYRAGSHRQFTLMARSFAAAGYATLRFDYRGMGDSDGDNRSFEHVDDDIAAAISALLERSPGMKGVVLFGLCDAASACLMYGKQRDPRVRGLILANPWVWTATGAANTYLRHYYLQRFFQKTFWVKLLSGSLGVTSSLRDLFSKLATARTPRTDSTALADHFVTRMLSGWSQHPVPTLLLLSERDLTAHEFENLTNKSNEWRFLVHSNIVTRNKVHGADHTFSSAANLTHATEFATRWMIINWHK